MNLAAGLDLGRAAAQAATIAKSTRMAGHRVTLFFSLLAVALNVVGAPMMSAHMADMEHASRSSMQGMEHCQGHADTGTSEQDSSPTIGHLPCCKGGDCTCGFLHAAAITVISISTHTAVADSAAAAAARAVPPDTVEDPLRPPIT